MKVEHLFCRLGNTWKDLGPLSEHKLSQQLISMLENGKKGLIPFLNRAADIFHGNDNSLHYELRDIEQT
jgi:hypothetical protein